MDPNQNARIESQTGFSKEALNTVPSGLDDGSAVSLALLAQHFEDSRNSADKRYAFANGIGSVEYAQAGLPTGFSARLILRRLFKLMLGILVIGALIALVPFGNVIQSLGLAVAGVSALKVDRADRYSSDSRSSFSLAMNTAAAKPLVGQALRGGVGWVEGTEVDRTRIEAMWAAVLQGYRPPVQGEDHAQRLSLAVMDYLWHRYDGTKDPAYLNDTAFAQAAISGAYFDMSSYGGARCNVSAMVPDDRVAAERCSATQSARYVTGRVINGLGMVLSHTRQFIRHHSRQLATMGTAP